MRPFDTVMMVDWSAAAAPSPRQPCENAIWTATAAAGGVPDTRYYRTRAEAEEAIAGALATALARRQRVLLGFDFAFAFPAGFAGALTGRAEALAVWEWLAERVEDGPGNANNRFAVADAANAAVPGIGPFWNVPPHETAPLRHLPRRKADRRTAFGDRRAVERLADARPQPVWNLTGAGAVGSQTLTGLPVLARLRRRFAPALAVWPFEDAADADIVLAEVYPSLIGEAVAADMAGDAGAVKDEVQVRCLAAALLALQDRGGLAAAFDAAAGEFLAEEGWILGVGAEAALRAAAQPDPQPPPLRDDCFALPRGVSWTPVAEALARLRDSLAPVVGSETCLTETADDRVLARDVVALRSHPPAANSAVDGFGIAAAAAGAKSYRLPLVEGRAAAGAPYPGTVPAGSALRILTGAPLPDGVDTVVLDEDTSVAGGVVVFAGPVKTGANTRAAGEDVAAGAPALAAGRVLRPPELGLLAAVGISEVPVRRRLRVGVLSTGDEIVPPAPATPPERTFDANRPMLLAVAARWGFEAVDLGHVGDDRAALAARLDGAARAADMVLTSGGASAGDEDHVSALLDAAGTLATWRIALKPGRPLALGLWRGTPVFGLPGNPVAALVCTLIFARPAAFVLAGAGWVDPQGYEVPATFAKRKKPGRREFLRARLDAAGHAEVFPSEGSGRISGLSWAGGLVELGDGGRDIRPGDPVRWLPYSSFGL